MNEKYVVVKREHVKRSSMGAGYLDFQDEDLIEDAVVIRTQDVFAAGGLSAYAHSIRAYTRLLRTMPVSDHEQDLANQLANRLEDTAQYFHEVAVEAEDKLARGDCKLPD